MGMSNCREGRIIWMNFDWDIICGKWKVILTSYKWDNGYQNKQINVIGLETAPCVIKWM